MLGQVTAAGSVSGTAAMGQSALAPPTTDQLRTLYGPGSELARLVARYQQRDPFATVYVVPLADDPGRRRGDAAGDLRRHRHRRRA